MHIRVNVDQQFKSNSLKPGPEANWDGVSMHAHEWENRLVLRTYLFIKQKALRANLGTLAKGLLRSHFVKAFIYYRQVKESSKFEWKW